MRLLAGLLAALVLSVALAAAQEGVQSTPSLTPLDEARLEIAKLQVEVSRLNRLLVECSATRVEEATASAVSKFLKSIEESYPGYTLDTTSGKLVKKEQ